jgi:hypothetical protein
MIQVFISINNNEEVMQLPVPPSEYKINSPWDNEQMKGLQGSINIIGLRGLKSVSISSFFPAKGKDYPYNQNKTMWGMEYVNAIERWRERRLPLRLVIVSQDGEKNVNMPVTIDNFEHSEGQDGDIYFTLSLSEFVFISIKR